MVNATPTIIFVPFPVWVGGSSFPGVTGWRPTREGKTPNGWPLGRQPIPAPDRRAAQALVDKARHQLSEVKARRLLQQG
jgi:hypothetical protein